MNTTDRKGELHMKRRDLDGAYFRVERNGRWESLCFTDLTREEQEKVLEVRTAEWLRGMVLYLASSLRQIGDVFDICCEYEDSDEE